MSKAGPVEVPMADWPEVRSIDGAPEFCRIVMARPRRPVTSVISVKTVKMGRMAEMDELTILTGGKTARRETALDGGGGFFYGGRATVNTGD